MKALVVSLQLLIQLHLCLTITSCLNKKKSLSGLNESVEVAQLKVTKGVTYYNSQPFSGKAFMLNAMKDTVMIDLYHEGKLHGISRSWFSSGQRMQERRYQNGRKEGVHKGSWSNGKMKFQYEFKNDEYHGHVKDWYQNGVQYKDFTYKDGHEEGPQKMWKIDGRIYANYVVKNNRIYGLSGRKQCKSLRKI